MESPTSYEDDLKLAHLLADQADQISMQRFGSLDLLVEEKADFTLVSDADRAVEDSLRKQLSYSRPDDSVYGEERGTTGTASRQWILDPIDGTNNFVRGVPVWATLIALVEDGDVVLGVVSAPALGRRWWAAKGSGAFTGQSLRNGKRLNVSKVANVEDAFLAYSSLHGWDDLQKADHFLRLQERCWRSRGFGDFWSYMLVAEGVVDIAAEPELALYDMAALVPIVREAGGHFTSVDGADGPWGGNAVASNGALHDEVLATLAGSATKPKRRGLRSPRWLKRS